MQVYFVIKNLHLKEQNEIKKVYIYNNFLNIDRENVLHIVC